MELDRFQEIVADQIVYSLDVLETKGKEYAPGKDRLEHFKTAAEGLKVTPKQALWGMAYKQLAAIGGFCNANAGTEEAWQERITDSINYMLLLWALVKEEADRNV